MSEFSVERREFLKGAAATGLALASTSAQAEDQQAENKTENFPPVKLGVIGVGMMGQRHITRLLQMQEYFQITAVCDVYSVWLDREAKRTGAEPFSDYRQLLESKNVEAVLIATPDHWHCLIGILACQATPRTPVRTST